MRIDGSWNLCDDSVVRPVIWAEVLCGDGSWFRAPFLVDTGADRTVLSADVLVALDVPHDPGPLHVSGVGGDTPAVAVSTELLRTQDGGGKVTFRGQFVAVSEPEALDMSVLGRDLTNQFAVIVDRPRDLVCLLSQRHQYTIEQK